jgi:DNA-3-methyladenine glycosylase I
VAAFDQDHVEYLLQDPGIVRNRSKVEATVQNARGTLDVVAEFGSLDAFLWGLVESAPIQNRWKALAELPAGTPTSEAMSKSLKARGFRFAGPTICYAFMQAVD